MRELLAATAKGQIEFTRSGTGRPILIVVGGHTNCRETIFQKGLDQQEFCFITPSRPGYGGTPLTSQKKTPRGTADLFVALLDTLGIKSVIIFGISAGGLTALEIAANYPERVESMILLSALTKKWFANDSGLYRGAKRIFEPSIERYTWSLYRFFFRYAPQTMAKLMFKAVSKYRPVEFTQDELIELKQMTLAMRSYAGFDNDLDQDIDSNILDRITCRTLIVHNYFDNTVDQSHPQNAKTGIHNSELIICHNRWGHLLWLGEEYHEILAEIKKVIN